MSVCGCVWVMAVFDLMHSFYKTVMDSLSIGHKEASKNQTAVNEVKKI